MGDAKMEGREGQQGQRQSQGSDVGTSDEVWIQMHPWLRAWM